MSKTTKTKSDKKVYMVFGYMDTGSGSLTYPEDFDFVGVYENKRDAEAHARKLNEENGLIDDPDNGCTDEMRYDVEELKVFYSKKPIRVLF